MSTLTHLKEQWNYLGSVNPFWAVLTSQDCWDEAQFFATGVQEVQSALAAIAQLNVSLDFGRALDFGCGVGRVTQALAEHFSEVHGVDIAPSMLARAEALNRHGVRCQFHLNDTDHLRLFPDNYFSLVYSNITLQHMAPRYAQAYILEFGRVLAPGGLLIFQLPSHLAPRHGWRQRLVPVLPRRLLALYHGARGWLRHLYHHHWQGRSVYPSRMEMHGIPRGAVVDLLTARGLRLLLAQPDDSLTAEHHWISYKYFFSKP